jgi:regulator of protease activity HflC (stomatin/prohibitin superfamily)
MVRERERPGLAGLPFLVLLLVAAAISIYGLIQGVRSESVSTIVASAFTLAFLCFLAIGFFIVNPNEGVVLQLFGDYAGTAKKDGLRWANPFYTKRRISLRVRNFESSHLKVNDAEGNPIEIAAVVVWKVYETAEAAFEVDDY